ncbi:hypothetical protein DTO271G3_5019 [Paecilomyces variotii]|nr:hypothetical protein DTO271G3_5019 [Paecilomyces variotii]
MVVCTYFQQGRCRFGERCKYEHPGQPTLGANRFGVLSGSGGGSTSSGGFGARSSAQSQQTPSYGVTAADIRADLSPGKGRPEWVFSSYGPGKNAPRQLFGGPQREQSFEEMRLRHYEAAAAGNPTPAIQEAEGLYAECLKQMDAAINDAEGAARYVVEGEKEHPNRIDITEGRTGPAATAGQGASAFGQSNNAFGQPTASGGTQSAFGKPTGLGQQPAFGQPAFGQPSFGQPSTLGQNPAFGQPSSLGQGAQGSAFGQPSSLGSSQSAFGKPAFGQPSFGQTGFGQPAFGKPSGPSPFGQTPTTGSGFSQLSSGPSPFGQPAGPAAGTGFGQPSTSTASPFGQAAQSASPFAQIAKTENPFGQPSTTASPFGAPAQQPAPSGFGQPPAATTASPFGQPPTATPAAPQPAPQPATTAGLGPRPQLKVDDPKELNPLPNLTGQTVRDPLTKKLTMWKGQPVKYIDDWPCYLHPDDRQTYVHIFFPDGPPDQASLRDAQGKPEEYTPEVTEQYEFFVKNGFFKDGVIPSVPPKTEWVSFDF